MARYGDLEGDNNEVAVPDLGGWRHDSAGGDNVGSCYNSNQAKNFHGSTEIWSISS